jgi:hypothetical protein
MVIPLKKASPATQQLARRSTFVLYFIKHAKLTLHYLKKTDKAYTYMQGG